MSHNLLPRFLPGRFQLRRGSAADYTALAMFHYIHKRPATWAGVWSIDFKPRGRARPRVVAVGVLSYPVPCCTAREQLLGWSGLSRTEKIVLANRNIRTISRIIVHPQFRSLSLSGVLVRKLCESCDTRYIESIARMAHAHPFFERAGMTRVDPQNPDGPVYFFHDRNPDCLIKQAVHADAQKKFLSELIGSRSV